MSDRNEPNHGRIIPNQRIQMPAGNGVVAINNMASDCPPPSRMIGDSHITRLLNEAEVTRNLNLQQVDTNEIATTTVRNEAPVKDASALLK